MFDRPLPPKIYYFSHNMIVLINQPGQFYPGLCIHKHYKHTLCAHCTCAMYNVGLCIYKHYKHTLCTCTCTMHVQYKLHNIMQLWCLYPGVFPLVGHGDHISVEQVLPLDVPSLQPGLGRGMAQGVTLEPRLHYVVIELLAPQ